MLYSIRWSFNQAQDREELNLAYRVIESPIHVVDGLMMQIDRSNRGVAHPFLRKVAETSPVDSPARLNASLALLPTDPEHADYLCDRLLAAKGPEGVGPIRAGLHQHAPQSASRFWPVLQDDRAEKGRRLRAACALALLGKDDPRWNSLGDDVVRCLAGENILHLREWATLLEPVSAHLDNPAARRLVEADAVSFTAYLAMIRAFTKKALPIELVARRELPATATQEDREAVASQQAQGGVALLHLERCEHVWPLFHQPEDPTLRTYLIHRCAALGVDPTILANHLLRDEEKDSSVRQGLLLALGEYSADQRAELLRGPIVDRVATAYREDSDPGIHSAAEWLLRRWHKTDRLTQLDKELTRASLRPQPGKLTRPHWVVNGQGQTFAVIPAPGKVLIGSRPDEKGRDMLLSEDRRKEQIDYTFAVATKLVTVADFKKCLPAFQHYKQSSPGKDTPINSVGWCDAARYCNWLSEQEKIPKDQWCYEPKGWLDFFDDDMKGKANYLSLSGYRLPTVAEWEYACRAGTLTAWAHGSDEALLGHYAWYSLNSKWTMHPVGWLKPNALGLFDMHGNAWQLCQDVLGEKEHTLAICTLRGGSFNDHARNVRSASNDVPGMMVEAVGGGPSLGVKEIASSVGFRVARTYR
jgi:formylglycine-generating enzyme required for sulfatase activity